MSRNPVRFSLVFLALLALAGVTMAGEAYAQSVPKQKGPARTVRMFDFFCLSQLPDLEAIERAAGLGEYDQITDDDLKPFEPDVTPEQLHAWRFHDQGEEFVLTAFRAPPNEALRAEAPAFAKEASVACSLHIPATTPDAILAELTKLLGRAPDKTLDGAQRVHVWTRQTDKLFSQVRFFVPANGSNTALLSGVVLLKG